MQVPAVLLLCRNSTDTAYFQRLRPYPRVLLRRTNTHFKGAHPMPLHAVRNELAWSLQCGLTLGAVADYSKTPIGFGICVFAIAKSSNK